MGRIVSLPDRMLEVDGHRHAPGDLDLYNGGQRLSLARLFAGFVEAIRNDGRVDADFARAAQIQRIVDALHQSNADRAAVSLG